MPSIPDRLIASLADRYRIERELGQGGMASVYVAEDLRHGRPIALKVLRPDLAAVLGPERFLNEIRLTARLDHPHIITLLDSGANDGFLWYTLPFIRGESLRARLTRDRQLGIDEALAITRQIAGALEFAHRRGVIHRDVKPENILLHEGEALLADFGIALAVKEAGGNRLTETGISLGTPEYMSPEQATGDRVVDRRSDLYSLAAVLYEMLAGEPPLAGATVQAVIAKLMTERPTRLRVLRNTVPEGLDHAVARALAKVPADRYESVEAFVQALGSTAPLPGRTRSGPRLWRRALVPILIVAALGAGLWLGTRGPRSRKEVPVPEYEQLTTTGNARSPALSPDGTRLAYVARECDDQARCGDRLIVSDTGGAGSVELMTGARVELSGWAAQGRFLIASVSDLEGRRRAVAIPVLGGAPRFLGGPLARPVGESDTVLLSPGLVSTSDSVVWLRVVTIADGLVRDSLAVDRAQAIALAGIPAPVGGRIAVFSFNEAGRLVRLVDRRGRVSDRLPAIASRLNGVSWTPRADALVWQADLGGSVSIFGGGGPPAPAVVLRQRVSAAGKFVGPADTLLRLRPGSEVAFLQSDSTLLLTQRPVEATLTALERSGPRRLDFTLRRLVASTAGLQAVLSRDGATVWIKRPGAGGARRRDTFMPFAGGPERPFDLPPGDEVASDWTRPISSSLLYAVRSGSDTRLFEIEVGSGVARELASLPARTAMIFSIPGGGYATVDLEAHSAQVAGRPGRGDTTWTVPPVPGRNFTFPGDVSADGRDLFEFSPDLGPDTVWVRRVPLDGTAGRGPVPVRGNALAFCPAPDGGLEYVIPDSNGVLGWYVGGPKGREPVRLGDAPIQGLEAALFNSDDCRRFIVVQPSDRPDAYLIRNFGALMAQ